MRSVKRYDELDFTDDFVFCKVLENNEDIAKELLELILQIKISQVVVTKQKPIEITADARGIRLDVYAEDDADSVYDIEMQTAKQKNLPRRSRYYQDMIDLNLIERGAKFNELKKSFVIFICKQDPFGRGLHIYSFHNTCRELPELELGDDTEKVFLNAAGTADDISDGMKDFFRMLNGEESETELARKITKEVEAVKKHTEWRREYMTLQMKLEEYRDIGFEEGYDEGKEQGYEEGKEQGYEEGKEQGYEEGKEQGYEEGKEQGYEEGKEQGYEEGQTMLMEVFRRLKEGEQEATLEAEGYAKETIRVAKNMLKL